MNAMPADARLDAKGAQREPSRRVALLRIACAAIAAAGGARPGAAWSQASPQEQQIELDREIAKTLPGARIREGRVRIELPEVADNGNSVPCTISVDSPMTQSDHLRTLHVWAARNPRPFVITAHFSPLNPRARLQTRLRLGESQRVLAVAMMSDGSFWSGHTDVVVSVSACQETGA